MDFLTTLLSPPASSTASVSATMKVNWLDRELPNTEDQREYARERCIVAVTEALGEALETKGISQAMLAKKLGVTEGRISHILSERNLTLNTIADVMWACGFEIGGLDSRELGVSTVPLDHATEWLLGKPGIWTSGALTVEHQPPAFVEAANNNFALAA